MQGMIFISETTNDTTKLELLINESKVMFCSEGETRDGHCFVKHVQVFGANPATSSTSTILVAFSVHSVLIRFTYAFWRWFVENGQIVRALAGEIYRCTVLKEVGGVLSDAKKSTWFWII